MAIEKPEYVVLLGRKIKEARKAKKISQEKLAEILDIHVTYVSQLERGEKAPALDTLLRISKVLEVSPAFLLELPEYRVSKEMAELMMLCSKSTDREVEIVTDILKVLIDKRNS